jgi:ribosome recycling factor
MQKTVTTIYLDPSQKRFFKKLAKEQGTTFSNALRGALDYFSKHKEEGAYNEEELRFLSEEANRSIERMIKKMDEAHNFVTKILKKMERKK